MSGIHTINSGFGDVAEAKDSLYQANTVLHSDHLEFNVDIISVEVAREIARFAGETIAFAGKVTTDVLRVIVNDWGGVGKTLNLQQAQSVDGGVLEYPIPPAGNRLNIIAKQGSKGIV